MYVFPKSTGLRAVNVALVWQERTSNERALTLATAEAVFTSMPVESIVGHLSMINTCRKENVNEGKLGI